MTALIIALAYACLGLLVGVISGLTDSSISLTLFATLFTFTGGTAAYFLQMRPSERKLVSIIVLFFSISCLGGLLSGIYIKVNRVLDRSPVAINTVYLKAGVIDNLNAINSKYRRNQISAQDAYEQTWAEIEKGHVKE